MKLQKRNRIMEFYWQHPFVDELAPVPAMARVNDNAVWERYTYDPDQWVPWPQGEGDVKFSGDWDYCTEEDVTKIITGYAEYNTTEPEDTDAADESIEIGADGESCVVTRIDRTGLELTVHETQLRDVPD